MKNGEKYTGVLSGTSLDPTEMRYVFKMVKRVQPAGDAQTNGTGEASDDYIGVGDTHVMSFDIGDVADFHVNHVLLDNKSQSKVQNGMLNDSCKSQLLTFGKVFPRDSAQTQTSLVIWLSVSEICRNGNRLQKRM